MRVIRIIVINKAIMISTNFIRNIFFFCLFLLEKYIALYKKGNFCLYLVAYDIFQLNNITTLLAYQFDHICLIVIFIPVLLIGVSSGTEY